MKPSRNLLPAVLALLLLGADAPPLDPDLRPAAPEGWRVEGKRDGGYEWLRFSVSEEMEGEDFKDDAITLYRLVVRVDPSEAGSELARVKVEKQRTRRREEVELEVEGVRWKGIAADYVSETGMLRRERYLYAESGGNTLYLFWSRGPAKGWEGGKTLRDETLARVSKLLAGRKPDAAAGDGSE